MPMPRSQIDAHENLAAVRRVLHRVLEKIAENLLETIAIALHALRRVGNLDVKAAIAHRGVMTMDDVAHERRPRNRLAANLQPSRFDARHIEQLENQSRHAIDLIERDVEILLGRPKVAFANERLGELRVALDRRDRRAQLVRSNGEKFVFESRQIFHFAARFDLLGVELRVLDGQGGALGEHFGERQFFIGHGAIAIIRGDDDCAE